MKTCSKCSEVKPLEDFSKDPRNSTGRRSDCRACRKVYNDQYRAKPENAVAARERYLKRMFGLTIADYDELAKDGCGVCGSFEGLVIDHDHNCCDTGPKHDKPTCGECVTGILCNRHNMAEGLIGTADEAFAMFVYMTNKVRIKESEPNE